MPTIRGSFGVNAGDSLSSSLTVTLPAGIVEGDIGWIVVSSSSETDTILPPAGWTTEAGPGTVGTGTPAIRYRLIRRVMDGSEGGTDVTVNYSTSNRPTLTGVVVAGGGTATVVRVDNTDDGADTVLDVPAIIPEVDDCLLIHLVTVRYSSSTAPTITPATGWAEELEHETGRTAAVNYAGYVQTKALTGGADVEHAATTATYSTNAREASFLIAVGAPPSYVWTGTADTRPLQWNLGRLDGSLTNTDTGVPTKSAQAAAASIAGVPGASLVGALNLIAGNALPDFKELNGVLNQLAGTSGVGTDEAASRIVTL